MTESTDIKDGNDVLRKIATDEVTINGEAVRVQRVKGGYGADGAYTDMDEKPATAALQSSATGAAGDAAPALAANASGTFGWLRKIVDSLASLLVELSQKTEPTDTQLTAFDPIQALGFYPAFTPPPKAGTLRGPTFDEFGAQFIRGGATTDEGSVRIGYAGAALAHSIGSLTFTNGSDQVTGSGILALDPQPLAGDYIKLAADAESAYARMYSIDSDGAITLDAPYTGTGGTGATDLVGMKPTTTGTGATITVSGGNATIACGTTAAQTIKMLREVDYGPLVWQSTHSISQRIANQTIYRGFTQSNGNRRYFAHFAYDTASNATVRCETGWAFTAPATGTDTETTTYTYPSGTTSATTLDHRIELRGEVVSFYIRDIEVARHRLVMPRPYDVLAVGTIVVNGTTPGSNTNVIVAYDQCSNLDSFRISIANQNDTIVTLPAPDKVYAYNVAGVIPINTDLIVIDCAQLASLSIHCESMGTTGVATIAWSNSPSFTVPVTASVDDQAGATTTTFNAAGLRLVNRLARFCRIKMTTATTAGTTTINVAGFSTPITAPKTTQPVSGTVTANIGTGSLAAGTNTIGGVFVAPATASGSYTGGSRVIIGSGTGHSAANLNVAAAATNIGSLEYENLEATTQYVSIYNLATTATLGSSTPIRTWRIPANTYRELVIPAAGLRLTTGFTLVVHTDFAATPNTAATLIAGGNALINITRN